MKVLSSPEMYQTSSPSVHLSFYIMSVAAPDRFL